MTVHFSTRAVVLPIILSLLGLFPGDARVKESLPMPPVRYAGKVNAPDFPEGLEWLNTERSLSLRDLRGKVVVLDFWTFCCINCMHIIPDLKKLEAKYPNELVVIGVHSAKFTTEQGTANIREAILRYGIEHPVVNDKDFAVWRSYAVNAWPTLIVIDPAGKIIGKHAGEGAFDVLDPVIAGTIAEFDKAGGLVRGPTHWRLERSAAHESFLSFPGKLAANPDGTALYVTDSNHHRIVVLSIPDGTVVDVIGSGERGLKDGSFDEACFSSPQGIAVGDSVLFVADTENHAVRRVDLRKRTVSTLAGTGKQVLEYNVGGKGTSVALNSPWDLVKVGDTLYVAMAGAHQIWTIDLRNDMVRPFAGSGSENIMDGPLDQAAFAQPSGITFDGTGLYIADSEVSGVRFLPINSAGKVRTIVGEGLFEFGDKDGSGNAVRLQHPIGIASTSHGIFLADTYNNKIKRVDPASRSVKTVAGTGKAGYLDGQADESLLNEPNGLVAVGDILYITDTNNHLIRTYNMSTNVVSTLAVKGMEKVERKTMDRPFNGDVVALKSQRVREGEGRIALTIRVPNGFHINGDGPMYLGVRTKTEGTITVNGPVEQNITHPTFPIIVPVAFHKGKTRMDLDLVVYYCKEGKEGLCLIKQVRVEGDVDVVEDPGAPSSLDVAVRWE